MSRYASIDIGSNTVKMLISEVLKTGKIKEIDFLIKTTELGKGTNEGNIIQEEPLNKTILALNQFLKRAKELDVLKIKAVATKALRDAKNQSDILKNIFEKTGINVNVISGEKEAEYSLLGVLSDLPKSLTNEVVCINTGGGSTEYSFFINKKTSLYSLNFGALTLTQKYFISQENADVKELNKFVQSELKSLNKDLIRKVRRIYAIGGTAVNLGFISQKNKDRILNQVNKHKVTKKEIGNMIDIFNKKSLEEKKKIIGLEPARVNIILAGALIFYETLDFFNADEFIVSTKNVSDGVIYELINE